MRSAPAIAREARSHAGSRRSAASGGSFRTLSAASPLTEASTHGRHPESKVISIPLYMGRLL